MKLIEGAYTTTGSITSARIENRSMILHCGNDITVILSEEDWKQIIDKVFEKVDI